jgi:MFS transporter, DHA1 family, multidrug resistance protein
MFKQQLRPPLKSGINPIVKAFIISEAFLWSGWYLVIPIAALFVANEIPGGNIQIAATGYSVHLTTRVIFELLSGKYLSKTNDRRKLYAACVGIIFTSIALFSFAFTNSVTLMLISYTLAGIGFGIGSPAKNALFSMHMDKDKETAEWGIADGVTFICNAAATAVGGYLAMQFGFHVLFFIAGIVSCIGLVPYLTAIAVTKNK